MNSSVKTRWVSALRSREYDQGYGGLHRGGKFCCLGVLTELAVKAGIISLPNHHSTYSVYEGSASFPPAKVIEWLESDIKFMEQLVTFNDSEEYSFDQIADVIEARK